MPTSSRRPADSGAGVGRAYQSLIVSGPDAIRAILDCRSVPVMLARMARSALHRLSRRLPHDRMAVAISILLFTGGQNYTV